MFMFKGKALCGETGLYDLGIGHEEGYVTGYYVDGYIVGEFVEVVSEYTILEFWVKVDKSTVEPIK